MTSFTASYRNAPSDPDGGLPPGLYEHGGVLRLRALDRFPELLHAVTTRRAPDGADWNLSARRGTPEHPADPAVALANREKLAALLGVPLDRMAGVRQVHGNNVVAVSDDHAGAGMHPDTPPIEDADGMITATPGLFMLALSADCPPVFLYDPERRVAGLVHSGWKGTVGRIAANGVRVMRDEFGSDPSRIVAAVGPGIGPCCYAVGDNVIEAAEAAFPGAWHGPDPLLERRDGQVYFSLREGVRRALLDAGLRPDNVAADDVCTAHRRDLFYSHRGEAGRCGLFGAVFGLRG
jgi:YfiH family protein